METTERNFAVIAAATHGAQHFALRLWPPLLPLFALSFGFALWKLGLMLSARRIGAAAGQAVWGVLSDRHDRRLLLPAGLAVTGITLLAISTTPATGAFLPALSVLGATFQGMYLLMVGLLFLNGVVAAVVHPTCYPLITANVEPENKGTALGMFGSASKFGDAAGPAFVGVLVLVVSWEGVLSASGLIVLAYAVFLFVALSGFETRPPERSPEEVEAAEAVWRADNRLYVYPMLAVFAFFVIRMVATAGVNTFIPTFITQEYAYTLSLAGYTVTAESTASFYYGGLLITAGVVQLATGALTDRHDARKLLIAYLLVGALTVGVLAVVVLPPAALLLVLVAIGASFWGLNPARDAIVSDITPAEREGRTFGYLWAAASLAGAFSPPIIGYLGDVSGSLRGGFLVVALTAVLSAAPIALLLSDRVYLRSGEPVAGRAD